METEERVSPETIDKIYEQTMDINKYATRVEQIRKYVELYLDLVKR